MIRLAMASCLVACSAPAKPVIANAPPVSSGCWTPSSTRNAYVISGHGEITDRSNESSGRTTTAFMKRLEELRFTARDLPPSVLAQRVPGDAAVVILLAPASALPEPELAAIDRYLVCGGALVLALDAKGATKFGPLDRRLGIAALPGLIVDDERFLPQRGKPSDRKIVLTTDVADHPATRSTHGSESPLILIESLALEATSSPTTTVLIRTADTSWLDLDRDFELDDGAERRQPWVVAAAIEGTTRAEGAGFRALVYGDADLFADTIIANADGTKQVTMIGATLLADGLPWLLRDGR